MSALTLRDILRDHGLDYIKKHSIVGQQKGIIKLLAACQTGELGTHYRQCGTCAHYDKAADSCRNRHCPNCQHKDQEAWLQKRMNELLPVGYYHLVFTIPHQLNALCQKNKKVMYDILFKAASDSLLTLTRDPKHLGADVGLIMVLHTWGSAMTQHPHLHCIMPAGGLSSDRQSWIHPSKKNDFLIHNKVISNLFKGKFMDYLKTAYTQSALRLTGNLAALNRKGEFEKMKDLLYRKNWVVNIQRPFAHPEKALEYLSRYVFRIAISNSRILKVEDGKVHFMLKNYRKKGVYQLMKLSVDEFISRFLLHLLPKGFTKVRYYGIFVNTHRKTNGILANELLREQQQIKNEEELEDGSPVWEQQDPGWLSKREIIQSKVTKSNCPKCKKGNMNFAGIVKTSHPVPIPSG